MQGNKIMAPLIILLDNTAGKRENGSKNTESTISQAARRMRFMTKECTKAAFQNLLINAVMSWPYMSAKASYQIPVVWISGCPIVWLVVYGSTPSAFPFVASRAKGKNSRAVMPTQMSTASSCVGEVGSAFSTLGDGASSVETTANSTEEGYTSATSSAARSTSSS